MASANDKILEVETEKEYATAQALRATVKPGAGATFFPQADEYLGNLKDSGKYSQYMADKSRIDSFRRFLKDQDLAFSDLTPGLLEKFLVFLRSAHKETKGKKALSERSVVNHLVVIRSVFAYARRNKIVQKDQSPFGGDDGVKIKFPDSKKVGLALEDVIALENVDLNDEYEIQRTISFKTSALDKILRKHVAPVSGIEGKLTMHIARHTFGALAGDTIPIQMLQKLYRHSHVSTTIGYQANFIHQDTDDALDAVIGKVNNNPLIP